MESNDWQQIKRLFCAVLDSPASERAAMLENADADLRREVEKLLRGNDEARDFISESAFLDAGFTPADETDLYIGKQIDSYEILEKIGHGGMGTVYLASRSDDFEKRVALKLIKRGMDTNSVLKRFRLERQILARLEHPFIASLLDGGSTKDDLPYFVMEFVEGLPVIKFCQLHHFSVEEHLELFQKICSAVSYAHQNLVVHRDIKPSNILVTADGTPKLLDFGIAKLLHPDQSVDTIEATATMFSVMTPEYASPEQLRGSAITTACDVYSLGVVLYELLTGERPFKIETHLYQEVAQIVLTRDPVRPSSAINRQWSAGSKTDRSVSEQTNPTSKVQNAKSLRGDLDNIILKALRKEPGRRYQSVQEFSEDIRRHLAGMPVTATADTGFYRIGKFIKRHRAGFFAGIFMFITLLFATVITSWQAIVARRERDKAEQRFRDVRKLSNSLIFEFQDAIENLSGATPARKLLIERALPFLDNLAEEAADDDSLQSELAESYRKLGEIQGHPTFPNVGDVAGGMESFRKSVKIGEELVRRDPNNPTYRINLAKYYDRLGDMYGEATYDISNALINYQKALRLREDLRTGKTEDPDLLLGLSFSYERVGSLEAKTGELESALKYYRDSLAISEQLMALQPTNNKLQRNIYISYYEIGKVLQSDGKYREALEQYATGRDLLVALMAAEPDDADLPRTLGISDDLSANAYLELGDIKTATNSSNQALAIREKLFAADPTNIQVYGDLTVSLDTAADLRVIAGDVGGALKLLRRSLEMREAALKQDPTMTLAKRYIAISRNKIAAALRSHNDLNSALVQQRSALDINRELCGDDPANVELRRELAVSLRGTGEILALIAGREHNREKWREARALLDESLRLYSEMKANDRAFGPDRAKIAALNIFIGNHERAFSR